MEIPLKGRAKVQKNNDYESYIVSRLLGYLARPRSPYLTQRHLHPPWFLVEHRILVLEE